MTLFTPFRLGRLNLDNRIVMAPMTRSRAGPGDVPPPLAATYYAQRATAGLIVSEAAQVSDQGKGYAFTPGIYTPDQIAGWRRVTDAVHAAGGLIFCQLWHVGRVSHPSLQADGALPVAPSAVLGNSKVYNADGFVPLVTPRALELAELPGVVESFAHGARCAMAAGFDGVEIHAAGGYLIDSFLRDGTNRRTDAYGGSIENRTRLLLEVTAAVAAVAGADRTGVRLAPISQPNDVSDSDPLALFSHVVSQLDTVDLAYLHIIEAPAPQGAPTFDLDVLRGLYRGVYMVCGGYDLARATAALATGRADLVAFGKPFIANPDLMARLAHDAPLAVAEHAVFYGGGEAGYTDWPTLQS